MIEVTKENFVTSSVFTATTLLLTSGGTNTGTNATAIISAPLNLESEAVALAAGNRVLLTPAGEGAYPTNAPWPLPGGSGNNMTFTSSLQGPGAALASFNLATPAISFEGSSPCIDESGNVYIISVTGATVTLRKYSTASLPFVGLWSYATTTVPFPSPAVNLFKPTLGTGVVYFMTTNGLHCVNSSTGVLNWVNPLRSFNYNFSAVLLLDDHGNVYGAVRDLVFCVAPSGVTKWSTFVLQFNCTIALDALSGILYIWCVGIDSVGEASSASLRLVDYATGTQILSAPKTFWVDGSVVNAFQIIIGTEYVYVSSGWAVCAFTKRGDITWVLKSYNFTRSLIYNPRLNLLYITSITNPVLLTPINTMVVVNGTTGALIGSSSARPNRDCIIDGSNQVYTQHSTVVQVFDAYLNPLASVANPSGSFAAFALGANAKLYVAGTSGLFVSN